MKKILILSITLLLQACANLGEQYQSIQPKEDEAVVYFYRPSRFVGYAKSFDIKEGDKVITVMPNNGYFPHKATLGEHTYTVESIENTDSVTLNVKKGQSYYVSSKLNWGMITGRPYLEVISNKEKALSEIRDCKLIIKD